MNRNRYTLKDFLEDPSFLNWISKSGQEDSADWENWLEKNPENKILAEEAAVIVRGIRFKKKTLSTETISKAWKELQYRIGKENIKPLKKAYSFYYAAAAVFIGIMILAGTYYLLNKDTRIEVATKAGEMKMLTLPDGTAITLRANSGIRYTKEWAPGETRKVWLKGEAFFNVGHGALNEKFNVITDELTLEVLGTTFTISSRRGKSTTVLNTGKIKLRGASGMPEVLMKPGDMAELRKEDMEFHLKTVNPKDYSAWIQHRFVFKDTPLQEVGWMIEDLYGVRVQIIDPALQSRKLSGEIEAHKLDELIRAISLSLNIKATGKENSILLEMK